MSSAGIALRTRVCSSSSSSCSLASDCVWILEDFEQKIKKKQRDRERGAVKTPTHSLYIHLHPHFSTIKSFGVICPSSCSAASLSTLWPPAHTPRQTRKDLLLLLVYVCAHTSLLNLRQCHTPFADGKICSTLPVHILHSLNFDNFLL